MNERIERYINPFTDFGFKKLFGEELNKDLLLDFLNELLRDEEGEIKDLTYIRTEQLGSSVEDRKAIFDLYCINDRNERFIVELQKTKQTFFKDRTLYYSTFPIREQSIKNEWNFELSAVYTVSILDFIIESESRSQKYRHDVKLMETETKQVFYNKLTFIYLEMPKFTKSIETLETRFEKWLYVLRNLNRLHEIPVTLQERIFKKLFEAAEIAQFTPDQMDAYEQSLKHYRDLKNSLETAENMGRMKGEQLGLKKGEQLGLRKGIKQGVEKVALSLLEQGLDKKLIQESTGLSISELEALEKQVGTE